MPLSYITRALVIIWFIWTVWSLGTAKPTGDKDKNHTIGNDLLFKLSVLVALCTANYFFS